MDITKRKKKNKASSKRRKTLKSIPESIRYNYHDYCSNTSIHGIKYVGENHRPLGERTLWLIVLTLCMIGNGYLIEKVWRKWKESPVIVSFDETTTPVWQVPFPAITFCSEQKSRATKFNFTEAYYSQEANETTKRMVADITLLCADYIRINDASKTIDAESTFELFANLTASGNELMMMCGWKTQISCEDMFYPIITEDGICYTFNMLSPRDLFRGNGIPHYYDHGKNSTGWTLENGYPPHTIFDSYPERGYGAGATSGLFALLGHNKDDNDYFCRASAQGFKILLHNPAEVPGIGDRFLRAPMKEETVIAIQPIIMKTSPNLIKYPPKARQCYFPSERYLEHFKIYTQTNCELECLTNHTLLSCGCVAIYMPRNTSTPVCGPGSKTCMRSAKEELQILIIHATYSDDLDDQCDCLPACTSIRYDAETSQTDFDAARFLQGLNATFPEEDKIQIARFTIFFKDLQFTTSKRSELFGLVDFLANCGGILGLFCGASLLSLVEIVYYLTFRFWSNKRDLRKKNKKYLEEKDNLEDLSQV